MARMEPTPLDQRPPHTVGCPIVKVQMALASVPAGRYPLPLCLIYSEDRTTVFYEGEATWTIVAMLDGRDKAFFYTAMVIGPKNKEKLMVLWLEAPWQDW